MIVTRMLGTDVKQRDLNVPWLYPHPVINNLLLQASALDIFILRMKPSAFWLQ